jgi:eukaryotic-like serine/threonine-protein kinase
VVASGARSSRAERTAKAGALTGPSSGPPCPFTLFPAQLWPKHSPTVQAKDVIADRFELLSLAGKGGMGEVWRAVDRQTGSAVALKLLRADVADAPRFLREARLLSGLVDPAIVGHVAHGTAASGELFLAMEWIEGADLADRLARGPLTPAESLAVTSRVARALATAHAAGIVHRDVKPNNVMLALGQPDAARLVDFGIARHAGAHNRLTHTGAIIGTPQYMAPEQARGLRDVDARVDVYALGCVLFECLTGSPPFIGETPVAVLARVLLEEPPRLWERWPGAPAALEALVARLLAKEPQQRPKDGAAVLALLENLDLSAAPGATPRPVTASERRLVTFVAGALPPADDSDDTTLTSSSSGTRLRAVAARFDCELELLAQGSFFASFSGAQAARDQVLQATRCARALARESPEHRVVVATGRAVVEARTPLGEVVDRATALLVHAPAGVLADSLTADLLDGLFTLGAHPHGALVGAELDAGSSGDARPLLGRATPFVGRDRELASLEALFAEAAEESAARIALVTAVPGLGKTRLRVEVLRRIADREPAPLVWLGRADNTRQDSPLGVATSALEGWLGPAADDAAARAQLAARVARLELSAGTQAQATVFLGELLGLNEGQPSNPMLLAARRDPMLMSQRVHEALTAVALASARAGPLVLVLEDLHWADKPTVTWVNELLRAARELPLFVLALARPEVHERFPRLFADHALTEVRLTELRPRAAERFVKEMLGAVDAPLVQRLVAAAAGNAFFLEELVRTVARGDAELPGSVVAMAQGRLERLSPTERKVLRVASVMGEVFWSDAVAALSGEADARATLKRLVDQELLVSRPMPRFEDQTELAFRHAFFRDAAYAMLTDADRAAGHLGAAKWLEAKGEPDARVLARHHELGGDASSACERLATAAEQSLRAGDMAGTQEVVARALKLGASGELGDRLAALELEALRWSDYTERFAQQSDALLQRAPPGSVWWCEALGQTARAYGITGLWLERPEAMRARLRELLALGEKTPALAGAEPSFALALSRLLPQAAIQLPDAPLPLLRHLKAIAAPLLSTMPALEGHVLEAESFVRWREGLPYTALRLMERAIAAYEGAGDVRYAEAGRINVGYALLSLGRGEDAGRYLDQLAGAARHSMRATRALGLLRMVVDSRTGALGGEELTRRVAEAIAFMGKMGSQFGHVFHVLALYSSGQLSELAERYGDPDAAYPFWDLRTLPAIALVKVGRAHDGLRLLGLRPYQAEMFGSPEFCDPVFFFAQALCFDAVGRQDESRAVLSRAHRELLRRAADVAEPGWREAYLEVPIHRELLALAAAWQV